MAGVARLRKALAVLLRDLEHTVDGFGQDLPRADSFSAKGVPALFELLNSLR
jgi:hypothetical protein